MDFDLSEGQRRMVKDIRAFCADWPDSYWKDIYERHASPFDFCKAYTEAGFRLMGAPEQFGGRRVDNVTKVLELMELGRCGTAALAVMFPLSSEIWPYELMQKTPQLEAAAHKAVREGLPLFAIAITEPGAGSDDSSIASTYRRENGKYILNGIKTFITDGENADFIYTICRDPCAADSKNAFSGFLVPRTAPGIAMSRIEKIGAWGQSLNEMHLNNVELENTALVGKEGNGFVQIMKGFEAERLLAGAIVTGWATAAYEDALSHARGRVQFGRPIGSFQLIQEKLVGMKIKLENMRNLVLKTAWVRDQGRKERTQPALCKLFCVQSAFEVCDDAMQIFGGSGYTKDKQIYRLWESCRFFRIGGGTDEIMIHIAGRQLLKESRMTDDY